MVRALIAFWLVVTTACTGALLLTLSAAHRFDGVCAVITKDRS